MTHSVRALGLIALLALPTRPGTAQPCGSPGVDDTLRLNVPFMSSTTHPPSLRTADLNRDGASDILTLDTELGSLWVYWGRRDRDLGPPRRLRAPAVKALHAVVDFQGLGLTDLVVETQTGYLQPARPAILLGDGAGGFQEVLITGLDSSIPPADWTWGDVNGDGNLDVAVFMAGPGQPTPATPSLETYLGDGRGAFRRGSSNPIAGVTPGISSGSGSVVLADVDGDDRLDAIVQVVYPAPIPSHSATRGATLLLRGDGAAGFGPARVVFDGWSAQAEVADVDRDGHADLFVGSIVWSVVPELSTASASILWGDGPGGLSSPSLIASGLRLGGYELADMDDDGRLDVLATDLYGLSVRRSLLGRTFAPPVFITNLSWAGGQIADVDGDGRADVVPRFVRSGLSFPVFVNNCGGTPFARTFMVPVVVQARGVDGTPFTSELVLTNRGYRDVTIDLAYTAASGGGSGTTSLSLARGRQRILEDVIADLRALGLSIPEGAGNVGSLRVRFSGASLPADVSVQSRIRSPFGKGEVGVGFAPLAAVDGLVRPSIVPLLRETADDRTNLALFSYGEPGDGDVTLRVTLFSTDAAHPGTSTLPDVVLSGGAFVQLDRVLAKAGGGMASAWARIERVDGDAAYGAFAVLNDNVSGDGSIVAAVAEWPGHTQQRSFPAIVETDSFTTELILTNASDRDQTVSLALTSPAIGGTKHREEWTEVILARAQVSVPGFAKARCARWATPDTPPAPCVGRLRMGGPVSTHGVVRTTATSAEGRFGLALQATDWPYPLGPVWLDGLRQDESHRTNIGLVNPGRYRIEIFDGDTGALAATVPDVEVGTGGWDQVGSVLYQHAPGVTNAYARVTQEQGYPLVYAVLHDGASPGLGNGDGTFIPMQFVPAR